MATRIPKIPADHPARSANIQQNSPLPADVDRGATKPRSQLASEQLIWLRPTLSASQLNLEMKVVSDIAKVINLELIQEELQEWEARTNRIIRRAWIIEAQCQIKASLTREALIHKGINKEEYLEFLKKI